MTEKPQPLSTQLATPSQAVFSLSNPVSAQHVLHKSEPVEEEPYTIKCICGYLDDDGNTILCETCDTWQHIDCYYPNDGEKACRAEFDHSCADCKPRLLDIQQAVERQRSRLARTVAVVQETPDRKPKRPPSKTQKKRAKPTDLQLNGQPIGNEILKHGSLHDQPPPPKKSKSSHKTSHSISSHAQTSKRSPSRGISRANPHGHPPSPATTPPDLPIDFTHFSNFAANYDEQDFKTTQANSFANLAAAQTMPLWPRNPEKMRQDTGKGWNEVFQVPWAGMKSFEDFLRVETKSVQVSSDPDRFIPLRYLTTPNEIVQIASPLMELNGQIGLQKDYCDDPDNRWADLTSPLPFVFFHPQLPLYLDTRTEGSNARYVRRSCRPNAQLETFVAGASEYHFWLVSDRPIAAGEQITIGWDFRPATNKRELTYRVLGLADEETNPPEATDADVSEYQWLHEWLIRILEVYGGCACERGGDCAFARFQKTYLEKVEPQPNPQKKKARKPKPTHAISPTSTGHATNSRAASEGHLDDVPENDGQSASGSSRGKPSSRDMTPARQGSLDAPGILTEPTDRDKRKVQMVEDSFRRMEQSQPPRKKKRVSDGTTSSSTSKSKTRGSTSHTAGLPNGNSGRTYTDTGVSKSKSGSPVSAVSPRTANFSKDATPRHTSIPSASRRTSSGSQTSSGDVGVQTDPVKSEPPQTPKPKPERRITPMSHALMARRHRARLEDSERKKRRQSELSQHSSSNAMELDSPTVDSQAAQGSPTLHKHTLSIASPGMEAPPIDIPMPDAPVASTHTVTSPALTNGTESLDSKVKTQSPDLRVQMPPVPTFSSPTSASAASTPISANGSVVHSPFSASTFSIPFAHSAVNGIAANPSPVKKKMSMSDYLNNKRNKAAAARPAPSTPSLKSSSSVDQPKSAILMDAHGMTNPLQTAKATSDSRTKEST